MNNLPIIDSAEGHELKIVPGHAAKPATLFGCTSAEGTIKCASEVATALREVVSKQGLIKKIGNKDYPLCEAWTLLGTIVGVFPVLCWSRRIEGGWEARVEARLASGSVVGAAEAECLKSEKNWIGRDDFALRSMAQTRATAKALRMPLGFVMTLAGYEPTPAEEMVTEYQNRPQLPAKQAKQAIAMPSVKPMPSNKPAKPMTDNQLRDLTLKRVETAGFTQILPEYLEACGIILENENLQEWPVQWLPKDKDEMAALLAKLQAFSNGEKAEKPFPPHELKPAA
jgi:hypothetical protein